MKKKLIHIQTIIILLINILLVFLYPLNKTNFTGIYIENPIMIILWALISSSFILYQLLEVINHLKLDKKKYVLIAFIIQSSCILSLSLPYVPEINALSTGLHLFFAALFFFSISLFFFYVLFNTSLIYPKQVYKIIQFYLIIIALCSFIYMAYLSVNGLFEVIYTCGLALCTNRLTHLFSGKTQSSTK